MRKIKIAGATLNQTPLDWGHNISNIINAIEEARNQKAHILVLPELCVTGYGCEDLFLSDWLSEKAWKKLQDIIPVCKNITVCVGLPVRIDGTTYNGVCVISHEKILGITLKQNLAKDGVHYETRWFEEWTPGSIVELDRDGKKIRTGDLIYEIESITFGFEICEDAWRKNRPGYNLKKREVELILNPSASHFALGKSALREQLVTESSTLFNCVYVYVNLLGNEAGRMIYDGDILVAQNGKLIAQNNRLSYKPFNLLCCEVDVDDPDKSTPTPLTDDKERNEELTRAVTLGLFDYLRKSKARGFVVSLSGGADSATCVTMVAEMISRATKEIGWEAFYATCGLNRAEIVQGTPSGENSKESAIKKLLTCAYQSTQNSSQQTLHAAQQLAEYVGAIFYHWSIQQEVDSYTDKIEKAINQKMTWQSDDISLQNIQARARSPIIWMLANIKQSILLTTSNRSEGDVGYATMDGDTSGSLAPISGIDKPTIRQWLTWAEHHLGYTGLKGVNNLQPTAELRPLEKHQTDEADLMPYTVLVEIEKHAILNRRSPTEVFTLMKDQLESNVLKQHIRKFFRLWAANQWKRERLAPSFHLDELNVDPRTWCRFPILSSGFEEELKELDKL